LEINNSSVLIDNYLKLKLNNILTIELMISTSIVSNGEHMDSLEEKKKVKQEVKVEDEPKSKNADKSSGKPEIGTIDRQEAKIEE